MMELVWWEIVVLIVAGFGAGLVNVMAGGGSILTGAYHDVSRHARARRKWHQSHHYRCT
jgi:F0F1-type ATP synthase assembly protein I